MSSKAPSGNLPVLARKPLRLMAERATGPLRCPLELLIAYNLLAQTKLHLSEGFSSCCQHHRSNQGPTSFHKLPPNSFKSRPASAAERALNSWSSTRKLPCQLSKSGVGEWLPQFNSNKTAACTAFPVLTNAHGSLKSRTCLRQLQRQAANEVHRDPGQNLQGKG